MVLHVLRKDDDDRVKKCDTWRLREPDKEVDLKMWKEVDKDMNV